LVNGAAGKQGALLHLQVERAPPLHEPDAGYNPGKRIKNYKDNETLKLTKCFVGADLKGVAIDPICN